MADRKMSEREEYDNGDKHILEFEIKNVLKFENGRNYCIRNKYSKDLKIFMKPEQAIDLMKKRHGTRLGKGDELVECFVSTIWGHLSIFNCREVKWEPEKEGRKSEMKTENEKKGETEESKLIALFRSIVEKIGTLSEYNTQMVRDIQAINIRIDGIMERVEIIEEQMKRRENDGVQI